MGYITLSGFSMESPTGFSTIAWLQRNPNLDSEEHSIFHKQICMASKEPDLNPLEFFIWSILEIKVLATPHTSLKSLKAKLQRELEAILQEQIQMFPRRLRQTPSIAIDALCAGVFLGRSETGFGSSSPLSCSPEQNYLPVLCSINGAVHTLSWPREKACHCALERNNEL
ncbi:hypothetical protein FHG87_012610 [Trinorchestia longiramus]|nr:hypothetical protein FHG87_012610 [Trinorchestia longiramus]